MALPVRSESASPSRRALLAGALGGLAAWTAAAIDRVSPAGAAAGGPLIMGAANTAGTTNTSLATNSTGTALLVTQNGSGTALRGSAIGLGSIAGFFTAQNGTGISGVTGNPSSYGIFGQNNGAAGTAGAIRAAGVNNHGLVATTAHADKDAVVATNTGAFGSGTAIRASGGNCVGLVGSSNSRPGVIGTSDSDIGVFGVSASGYGVYGESTSSYGVRGSSTGSYGVYGVSGSGDGVRGLSTSSRGVYGSSTSFVGVTGQSTSNTGVFGQSTSGTGVEGSSDTGNAGSFFGPVYVSGLLTKGGGGFKVDHPLDPANQYLQHSFVESPDMKNVYDGVVTLDATGEATVELPTYFETLNRDLRYQLTAVGAAAPDLHVKAKLAKGRFAIGGGSPGLEVCWQVTGIRQDPFAEEHPIVVEQTKSAKDKGKYLHPELYGQPKSKAEHPSPEVPAPVAPIG